ncbi:SDR family NAD(P)-dependent oxidoreductase [Streptomyces luomodiensis]|uniref:SDR family NAD(P)-dependent oxidoreductase n=1 Tax=Streptomyces luomodiensis TaxID=3026192 RepID=A0ABY9URT7_9ACTN|nr:SDR family NAD(P)-dependent oxidoreductase [Streptomyces sp. SCA4-21]WNE95262.1 SDR family NAD(P)-dependent oxidoreductase [Streptomyces sp. SCA4-21]
MPASPAVVRTAVVTGAGSQRGIGRATAHRLAAAGYEIAVLDLDEAAAKEAAAEIAERHGVRALGVRCDVTDRASVDSAVTEVEGALAPIGALVNNAGITDPSRFLDIEPHVWRKIFAVNVDGTYHVTQRIAGGMVERGFGRIVNLSSVSAQRGGGVFGGSHYSAAKGAVLGLTRAVARELGGTGVTVNAVAPGLIDTDITGGALVGEQRASVLSTIPAGRAGSADDVAVTIAFLCTPEAEYLTGTTVDINGGSHIH